MLAADSQALEITEVSSYHLNEKSLSSFFHVVFLTACLTSPQIRFKKLPRGLVLFTLFLFFFHSRLLFRRSKQSKSVNLYTEGQHKGR